MALGKYWIPIFHSRCDKSGPHVQDVIYIGCSRHTSPAVVVCCIVFAVFAVILLFAANLCGRAPRRARSIVNNTIMSTSKTLNRSSSGTISGVLLDVAIQGDKAQGISSLVSKCPSTCGKAASCCGLAAAITCWKRFRGGILTVPWWCWCYPADLLGSPRILVSGCSLAGRLVVS